MKLGEEAPAVAVLAALGAFSVALDQLVAAVHDGGLDHLDSSELVAFLQDFETVRNRMPLVDHRTLRDAEDRDLAGQLSQGTLARVLTSALRISAAEAGRRVRASEKLSPRVSVLGQGLAPARSVLAACQRAGGVTTEQVQIILRGLAKVDRPGFDPADVDRGEQTLTEFAATFGPKDLQVCVDRFVDHIDPDGSRPRDELNADRRHVELRSRMDGSWVGQFQLTGALGAKLQALLSPLAKPRINLTVGPQGGMIETRDERTHGQRVHDALEDVCDRLLRAGGVPDSGGVPATVIVTLDVDDLIARTGYGTTSDGTLISTREVLELAAQAEIIPAVLDSAGAVLSLGRSRRIATRPQTLALIARDRGCSFPGCDHPPEWCERHHIRGWVDGGPTDLDNLTLLCRYHHRNFASRGWVCRMRPDGIPEWIPPLHVDRDRTPMINTRIQAERRSHGLAA